MEPSIEHEIPAPLWISKALAEYDEEPEMIESPEPNWQVEFPLGFV